MKKLFFRSLIILMLLVGFTVVSYATVCSTVYFECENGNAGAGLACGETYAELYEEWIELGQVICSPDGQ